MPNKSTTPGRLSCRLVQEIQQLSQKLFFDPKV